MSSADVPGRSATLPDQRRVPEVRDVDDLETEPEARLRPRPDVGEVVVDPDVAVRIDGTKVGVPENREGAAEHRPAR
jgi:hypothetical protein